MKKYLPECQIALDRLVPRLPDGALMTLIVNVNGKGFVVSEDELENAKKILLRTINNVKSK